MTDTNTRLIAIYTQWRETFRGPDTSFTNFIAQVNGLVDDVLFDGGTSDLTDDFMFVARETEARESVDPDWAKTFPIPQA